VPSWFLVGEEDRIILAALQRYMAERAHAQRTVGSRARRTPSPSRVPTRRCTPSSKPRSCHGRLTHIAIRHATRAAVAQAVSILRDTLHSD
jgi:hypothetical protein